VSSGREPADGAVVNGNWQLPRGPHKLPREIVVDHQCRRLLEGAARALAAHGYAGMNVGHILEQAGVSRTTFYEHFDNKRECLTIAHEEAFDRFVAHLFRACAAQPTWPAKVTAAVGIAIDLAVRSPHEAQLLIVDAVAADPDLGLRVLASNDFLVGLLRNGREQCPGAASLPELTERAQIGATASVIGHRLLSGQADRLPALKPELVQLILIPYLGLEEAARAAASSVQAVDHP
jgi:AcrR family transcriptional regulator